MYIDYEPISRTINPTACRESTPPSRRRRHRHMLRMGRESDSSPDSSADDSTGILRLLEQVRTQPHQAELQRAMELSRREFEEQEQLQAGEYVVRACVCMWCVCVVCVCVCVCGVCMWCV